MKYQYIHHKSSVKTSGEDVFQHIEQPSASMTLIGDGHSGRSNSDAFSRAWLAHLSKAFVTHQIDHQSFYDAKESFRRVLSAFQQEHKTRYPAAAMSFLILIVTHTWSAIFFVGDCRIGTLNDTSINWLNSVHSATNALTQVTDTSLRVDSTQHQLTRSFKARRFEFEKIEAQELDLKNVSTLILATDGFWSELSCEGQLQLLQTGILKTHVDDVTCIRLDF